MGEEEEDDSTTIRIPPAAADEEQEEEQFQTINTIDAASVVVVDTDDKRQRQAEQDDGGDAAVDDDTCSTAASSAFLLSLQEERNIALRRQLAMIRAQRQRLARWRAEQEAVSLSSSSSSQITLQQQSTINELQHQQDCALQDFLSIVARRRRLERMWHNDDDDGHGGGGGLNDCFLIRHQGPFATINGLRLGYEAILSSGPVENNIAALSRAGATAIASTAATGSSGDHHHSNGTVSSTTALMAAAAVSTRVPWSEINAALGLLALLLSSLEKKPHCGIRYRHEIHCAGSTSKMGYRAAQQPSSTATSTSSSAATAATMYNLYYSDDGGAFNSFNFFARRNFNTALHCLVQCVVDAADVIQQRDPTITMPHVIETKHHTLATSRWEFTVDGLPVAFGGGSADNNGIEWTRAMKYLLTNVKTLLVFRPFGLWDPAAESNIT